jgi:hypothetical protein
MTIAAADITIVERERHMGQAIVRFYMKGIASPITLRNTDAEEFMKQWNEFVKWLENVSTWESL